MSPRKDVSEERKLQILEAATRVFAERGFARARMDDIVAESGLSKGALYWYFESKDAIIISILDQIFNYESSHLQDLIGQQDSAEKMLRIFVEGTIQDITRIKPLMPIFFEFWSLSVRKEVIKGAIKRYYQNFLDLIETILRKGIISGEFREVDVTSTSVAIGALYEGTILFYLYFAETLDFEAQFRSNLDLVLNGLLREPQPEI